MFRATPTTRRLMLRAALAGAALLQARPSSADTLATVRQRGTLICAADMQFPPFDFRAGLAHIGVDRDLMDTVAHDLGLAVVYQDTPWTSILPGLDARAFDFVVSPVIATPERLKRYGFTVPVADATVTVLKRADDGRITRPADLANKRVGAEQDSGPMQQLAALSKTLVKPVEILDYPDAAQCYTALAAGEIDAVAGALPQLGFAAARHAGQFALVLPAFGKPSYYYWVGRLGEDDQKLTEAISAVLIRMQDDGRLGAIQTKWFGQPIALPRIAPVPSA